MQAIVVQIVVQKPEATINVTGLISSKEFKSFNLTDIKNPW